MFGLNGFYLVYIMLKIVEIFLIGCDSGIILEYL